MTFVICCLVGGVTIAFAQEETEEPTTDTVLTETPSDTGGSAALPLRGTARPTLSPIPTIPPTSTPVVPDFVSRGRTR
jgi:hypothetical protein